MGNTGPQTGVTGGEDSLRAGQFAEPLRRELSPQI